MSNCLESIWFHLLLIFYLQPYWWFEYQRVEIALSYGYEVGYTVQHWEMFNMSSDACTSHNRNILIRKMNTEHKKRDQSSSKKKYAHLQKMYFELLSKVPNIQQKIVQHPSNWYVNPKGVRVRMIFKRKKGVKEHSINFCLQKKENIT